MWASAPEGIHASARFPQRLKPSFKRWETARLKPCPFKSEFIEQRTNERMSLLEIKNLHANVGGTRDPQGHRPDGQSRRGALHHGAERLGQEHAGAGAGAARELRVTAGEILFNGKDLLAMKPEDAACEGVFLAFQYPVEIPGISNAYFLRSALNAIRKYHGEEEMDAMDFLPMLREKLKLLEMDEQLMNRSVNEGFSGGEKKRNEILQMAVLEPKLAILDETDSGLDIDALRIVAKGVNAMRSPERAVRRGHALPAPAELHRAGFRARAGGRPHRALGRPGAGAGTGREGLQPDRSRTHARPRRAESGDNGMTIVTTATPKSRTLSGSLLATSNRRPRAAISAGCGSSARTPSRASAKLASRPRTTKTGASPVSRAIAQDAVPARRDSANVSREDLRAVSTCPAQLASSCSSTAASFASLSVSESAAGATSVVTGLADAISSESSRARTAPRPLSRYPARCLSRR